MASSSLCEDTTCFEIQTRDLITPLEEDVIDATTSCKNTWYTPPYFGLTDLLMLLCLWSLLLRLSKLLAIQDHTQDLVEQLEIKGRGRRVLNLTDVWPAAIWSKKGWFSFRARLSVLTRFQKIYFKSKWIIYRVQVLLSLFCLVDPSSVIDKKWYIKMWKERKCRTRLTLTRSTICDWTFRYANLSVRKH